MSRSPQVSAIIIFLNEERFLEEAIQSVFAQSHGDWELLLVDDGSSDRSSEIARRCAAQHPEKVLYLEHEGHANRGMSASRNLGIDHARGEFIAFLDADDVWLPTKLEQQVAILKAHPDAAMVYGRTQIWHSWTGKTEDATRDHFFELGVQPDSLVKPPALLIQLLENKTQTPTTCNFMVRRDAFKQVGRFEESFRGMFEDQAFFIKLELKAPVFVAGETWAKYRQHPKSHCNVVEDAGKASQLHEAFLQWAADYFRSQNMVDAAVWKTWESKLAQLRQPIQQTHTKPGASLVPRIKNRLGKTARGMMPGSLRRWLRSRALILLYHRVVDLPADPYLLSVKPDHFARQMEVLRKHGSPISLAELIERLKEGRLPRRAIVVTFDDGYLDNLQNAKPILERHGIPATVFVTSGHVGGKREFWWDELEKALLRPGSLPEKLSLVIQGEQKSWELGEASQYSEAESRRTGWNAYSKNGVESPRQRFFQSLYQTIVPLAILEKQKMLEQLLSWSGSSTAVRRDHATVSREQALSLAQGGLVGIGAHTVTHPMLTSIPASEQLAELQQSRADLEQLYGCPVTSIAYPHGEYSPETLEAARKTGYVAACTCQMKPVTRLSENLELPRVQVGDWDGDEMGRNLEQWFNE